jgi:hypothetical protein
LQSTGRSSAAATATSYGRGPGGAAGRGAAGGAPSSAGGGCGWGGAAIGPGAARVLAQACDTPRVGGMGEWEQGLGWGGERRTSREVEEGKICWGTPFEGGFCSGPLKNIVFVPKH